MSLEKLMSQIQERSSNAEPLGKKLKFDLGDDKIHIDGTGDSNAISTNDDEADTTIEVSPEDFQQLLDGDLNPMGAVMAGKIKIKGDMGLAMKLQSLF